MKASRVITRRRAIWAILVVLLAGGVVVKYGRHYFFPKRFAVVVPGELYRSGYLEPWPLERVIRQYRLKTVLCLLGDEPDMPDQRKEEDVLAREHVELIRIGMPGDGLASFDLLEQAANVLADESRRPLLVHCAAGVNRTGAALAVWRMKHCGWDADQALAEAEQHGLTARNNPELQAHLREYYWARIASQDEVKTGR